MRTRAVPLVAWAALAVVFVVDLVTPQGLIIAILGAIPVALGAFAASRRLTTALAIAAIAGDAVAALVDARHDGGRFDGVGVLNRVLTAVVIIVVAALSTLAQERTRALGLVSARDVRVRRETALATAVDRLRSSLSSDLVARAIVREAPAVLDVAAARWYPADRLQPALAFDGGDVGIDATAETPEVVSLVRRVLDDGAVARVRRDDPLGAFALDRVGAPAALAIPVGERDRPFGVVLALGADDGAFPDGAIGIGRAYGRAATAALAQAKLFGQLAERNDELAERGAVIRDLVYALSHDLRTPLAALGMTLRQAEAGAYGALPAAYGEVVRRSVVATDDLQRLADTLLSVARFESGERRPEREPLELGALARQVAGELDSIAHSRGVALRVATEPEGTVTRGDRGDVRRAIGNLIANALQHTPEGGAVTVTVESTGRDSVVRVDDDGFGVTEATRASLFGRFASASSRGGGGTGLGLYLVRRVAEELGGGVRYAPREPRGSSFSIVLPGAGA